MDAGTPSAGLVTGGHLRQEAWFIVIPLCLAPAAARAFNGFLTWRGPMAGRAGWQQKYEVGAMSGMTPDDIRALRGELELLRQLEEVEQRRYSQTGSATALRRWRLYRTTADRVRHILTSWDSERTLSVLTAAIALIAE